MNQLTCKICGETDLIKQDGAFVCQNCGMKHSVEEAKKMMIEKTVDVQGTAEVDNSALIEKYLADARCAKQKEDWTEAEKYYNMVKQNDPTNIEAIFYSSYGKAKLSLMDSDLYKRQAAFKALQNCISAVYDNFVIEKEEENKKIIEEISSDIFDIANSNYVFNMRTNGYGIVTIDKEKTIALFNNLGEEFMYSLENIAADFSDDDKEKRVYYYKLALKHAEFILQNDSLPLPQRQRLKDSVTSYRKWVGQTDPSHEAPAEIENQRSSGCYVATAVYGTYDCPEVWTLRRFRDDFLAETQYGRAFVRIYYAVSPTLVKWFGDTDWFKKMWRRTLDRMVKRLQSQGFEATPYKDKF